MSELTYSSNTILITESLLINGARMIEGSPFNIRLFFDLASLIEAVVLHDRLFVFEADVAKEFQGLELRQLLYRSQICQHFIPTKPGAINDGAQKILSLRKVPWWGDGIPFTDGIDPLPIEKEPEDGVDILDFINRLQLDIAKVREDPAKLIEWENPDKKVGLYRSRLGDFVGWGLRVLEEYLKDEPAKISDLDLFDFVHTSTSGPGCAARDYLLRTAMYFAAADCEGITYYPDYRRIPMLLSLSNRLKTNISRQAYDHIVKALAIEFDELAEDGAPFQVPIPPLTALVLDRCSRPADIPSALMEVRDDFVKYRLSLAELGDSLRNAKSIHEARKVKGRMRSIFDSYLKKVSHPDDSIVSRAVSLLFDDVAKAIEKPTSPTSYSLKLLSQPYQWIREWWLRRPMNALFSMERKVAHIQQYQGLINKVFGVEISPTDFKEFKEYSTNLQRYLYPNSGRPPSA